jgi:hypothetical protein
MQVNGINAWLFRFTQLLTVTNLSTSSRQFVKNVMASCSFESVDVDTPA